MTAVAAKYDEISALGAEVLAISVDSVFSHKVWHEEELIKMVEGGIPYPLLADKGGQVGKMYGVYDEKSGMDIRGRFIIDPDGVIQAAEILTPPVGRNVAELIRQLKAYQYVRATGGAEVTPSGWEPGKPTLKPGAELAGKVWKVWKPD